jgi:hypothetical protein
MRAFMDDLSISRSFFPLKRSARPLLLLLLFLLAGVLVMLAFTLANLSLRGPEPSEATSLAAYEFGVAVTYFQVDAGVELATADRLIDQLYLRLESELASFTEEVGFTLGLLPPETFARIEGDSPPQREANAHLLAEQYQADIVLYGTISENERGTLTVQPEFYVFPGRFREALEITGSYRLGSAITLSGQLGDMSTLVNLNQPLGRRTISMAEIMAGLAYYAAEDFENARAIFQQVLDEQNWGDAAGQEIIYVLLGNSHLSLAIQDLADGEYRV